MPNLQSSVNKMGKIVTQIIHFSNGNKRTFKKILTETIEQGEFTKMKTQDGIMILVNPKNVDAIEVFEETSNQDQVIEKVTISQFLKKHKPKK